MTLYSAYIIVFYILLRSYLLLTSNQIYSEDDLRGGKTLTI